MRIKSIRVEKCRILDAPVTIKNLGGGITIIGGNNETGKSTLLDVIRASFFVVQKLEGVGSDARAEIRFESDGISFQLVRQLADKTIQLTEERGVSEEKGETLSADPARGKLFKCLGVEKSGQKGGNELLGIFWVQQNRIIPSDKKAEEEKSSVIRRQMRMIYGGLHGSMIIERVKELDDGEKGFFNKKNRAPKGELKEYQTRLETAEEELQRQKRIKEENEIHKQELEECNDRMEGLDVSFAENKKKKEKWENLSKFLDADKKVKTLTLAKDKFRDLESQRSTLAKNPFNDSKMQELRAIEGDIKDNGNAIKTLSAKVSFVLTSGKNAYLSHREEALPLETNIPVHERDGSVFVVDGFGAIKVVPAGENIESLSEAYRQAYKAWDTQLRELGCRSMEEAEERNEKYNQAVESRDKATQLLEGNLCNDDTMNSIQGLNHNFQIAQAALNAAITKVRFLPSDKSLQVRHEDKSLVDIGEGHQIKEKTRFHLDNFGAIEVTPGVNQGVTLQEKLKNAQENLQSELKRVRCQDMEQVKQKNKQWKSESQKKREAEHSIEGNKITDEQIEALVGLHSQLEAARNNFDSQAASVRFMPTPDKKGVKVYDENSSQEPVSLESSFPLREPRAFSIEEVGKIQITPNTASIESLRQDLDQAKEQLQKRLEALHCASLEDAEKSYEKRKETEKGVNNVENEIKVIGANILEPELLEALSDKSKAVIGDMLQNAQSERDSALQALEQCNISEEERRLSSEQVEEEKGKVDEDWQKLNEQKNQYQKRIGELREEIARKEGTAPFDLFRYEEKRDNAQKEFDDMLLNAEANHVLLQKLEATYKAFAKQHEQKVSNKYDTYANLMGYDSHKDSTISTTSLPRFRTLSIGTQEQLAVLVRLAFADYFHSVGKPSMVILDDAFVHADDERLHGGIKKCLLHAAAQGIQIIVLTCHQKRWTDSLDVGEKEPHEVSEFQVWNVPKSESR